MSVTVSSLEPAIRAILTDPSTDLSSISAKRVRKQLVESADAVVTTDFVRANKDDIDALIAQIFEVVSADGADQEEFNTPTPAPRDKRKRNGYGGDDDDNGDYAASDDGYDDPPAKKHKSKDSSSKKSSSTKSKAALTDEELARQLSQELNSNPSRRSGSARVVGKRGASRTPKRIKKSRDIIDDDSDLSPNDDASPKPKKKRKPTAGTGGGGRGGFQKEMMLSEPLAHLMQTDRMSRTQVVKKLWEHIRAHDLQNPANRRQIICDPSMRAVFKQDKVDMFTMNKLLKDHLSPLEE
ncbi:SWIB-domain-containing protein [Auricularia subglabra TFB-10046 SS5]|nr:SWIB-domain-containing protein [Auricularia subglabra TFB-10046 SS5]